MKKTIIYITNIPFMKHHVQDMYINEVSESFDIELWDLSSLYNNKDQLTSINNTIKVESTTQFEERLSALLKDNCQVVVVTNILCHNLAAVYPIIHRLHIPLVNINKDLLAGSLEDRGALSFIRYYHLKAQLFAIARHTPIISSILRRRKTKGYKYDYLMGGANYYPEQSRNFLQIHQIKYDEYLRAQNAERLVSGKYILFVGAGPTSHPAYIGYPHTLNHEYYMGVMRRYLDDIEKQTGLPVVISGHPKGRYVKEEWGNRPIFIGNTADLIHFSEGVICHFSTSLVNAILEYKPIQIVYDGTILKSAFRKTMVMGLELGKLCNADLCNMDKSHRWKMAVDKNAYDIFLREEIINEEHKDKSDAELITMYLNQIFEKEYRK